MFGFQPFPMIYLVNNTDKKLTNTFIRLENYNKKVEINTLKKGDVVSKFLFSTKLKGERDIYFSYSDEEGNDHEYLVYEKYNCSEIKKIKLRINSIKEDRTLSFECVIDVF
ncbi:MAG: hypothetical protein ACRC7N_13365 [Clostridium sp.]